MSDTLCDIKWQRVAISANFSFFWIRAEPTSGHPKENSLNIEEDFEEGYWIKSRNKPLGIPEAVVRRFSSEQVF